MISYNGIPLDQGKINVVQFSTFKECRKAFDIIVKHQQELLNINTLVIKRYERTIEDSATGTVVRFVHNPSHLVAMRRDTLIIDCTSQVLPQFHNVHRCLI